MKVSGFFVSFLVVGTALMFFVFSSPTCSSWFSDLIATNYGDRTTLIAVSRKLKENDSIKSNNKGDGGHMILDDYHSIDPVPRASVNTGPIQHGTPLNPHIPKPPPPAPPSS